MPYIIMKRNDIPAGTLQVLDLVPNESLRNLIYEPVGQTKYVNPVENDRVVTRGAGPIVLHRDAKGLAAWFITNVNDGTGAIATLNVSIAAGNASDGDTVTVNTTAVGGPSVTFTFRAAPVLSTDVQIGGSEPVSATNLAAAINLVANGLTSYVAATAPGGGPPSTVEIAAATVGTAGNGILISSSGANLTPVGPTPLAGGVDANALTAADANANADAVLGLYAYGDLTSSAGALTLAAINGALATGALEASQLSEVLDILAGRKYFAPAGTQVDSNGTTFSVQPPVGSANGPGFLAASNRLVFRSGALNISFAGGHLEAFGSSSFVYAGVAGNPNGEAVVVYNDDGTLFTPGL
jgi:hypothetical protein